ncbi:hypothetical protein G6F23_014707 [Rhizopus arrhizus]|nr:hypothetical protein G6F23_014707 [Rhizopus arrhizus]
MRALPSGRRCCARAPVRRRGYPHARPRRRFPVHGSRWQRQRAISGSAWHARPARCAARTQHSQVQSSCPRALPVQGPRCHAGSTRPG